MILQSKGYSRFILQTLASNIHSVYQDVAYTLFFWLKLLIYSTRLFCSTSVQIRLSKYRSSRVWQGFDCKRFYPRVYFHSTSIPMESKYITRRKKKKLQALICLHRPLSARKTRLIRSHYLLLRHELLSTSIKLNIPITKYNMPMISAGYSIWILRALSIHCVHV